MDMEKLMEAVDAVFPAGATHIGLVIQDIAGRVLVTEPKGHPYGVSATFNKVRLETDERPSAAISRCLNQQVGQGISSAFPIPIVWSTSNANSFYFTGLLQSGGDPVPVQTHPSTWCSVGEAEERIRQSANGESRHRDLGLLANAAEICVSPFRRILLMVRELHRLGFQRLRAAPYLRPIAWRCPIVPAWWTLSSHGCVSDLPGHEMATWFGGAATKFEYSSSCGQFPFDWAGVAFDTPRDLALRFVRELREIAFAGLGPDKEYSDWFERALELTAPNGVFYASAEYQGATDHLYTDMTSVDRVPLPPPGWARQN